MPLIPLPINLLSLTTAAAPCSAARIVTSSLTGHPPPYARASRASRTAPRPQPRQPGPHAPPRPTPTRSAGAPPHGRPPHRSVADHGHPAPTRPSGQSRPAGHVPRASLPDDRRPPQQLLMRRLIGRAHPRVHLVAVRAEHRLIPAEDG